MPLPSQHTTSPDLPRRRTMALTLGIALIPLSLKVGRAQQVRAGRVDRLSVEQARTAALDKKLILVDIRTPQEWRDSGIPDVAVALDMTRKDFIRRLLSLREAQPDVRLGLICAVGGRSRHLAQWLARQGVPGIVDVPAGLHTPRNGWLARKLPVRAPGPDDV